MGLLQSYPLSRLGASTAVSTVSASGEGVRQRSGLGNGSAAGTSGEAKSGEGDKTSAVGTGQGPTSSTATNASGTGNGDAGGVLGANTPALLGGRTLHEARFSLATLLMVALICFLAGSLLRAMLSPADFVFLPPTGATQTADEISGRTGTNEAAHAQTQAAVAAHAAGAAVGEVHRLLFGGGPAAQQVQNGLGDTASAGAAIAWRRVLRLLEIKRAIAGRYDLVLAVIDRRL